MTFCLNQSISLIAMTSFTVYAHGWQMRYFLVKQESDFLSIRGTRMSSLYKAGLVFTIGYSQLTILASSISFSIVDDRASVSMYLLRQLFKVFHMGCLHLFLQYSPDLVASLQSSFPQLGRNHISRHHQLSHEFRGDNEVI